MEQSFKKYWSEFKTGINIMFKEFFNKETNKKQRANMWTFTRLITSFFIPLCSLVSILCGSRLLVSLSVLITIFGGTTDFFDGRSARKYNSSSEFGSKLDQVTDKIFSMMLGINLSLFNPMFLITLLGECLIVLTNTPYKLKYDDLNIKSTQMGRLKQWPLFSSLGLGFMSILIPGLKTITNISILITFLMQILTAGSYVISNNSSIKELKEKKNINNLVEIEDNNEKVKTKSIDNKNNKDISKIEQYTKLKDLLNEIINMKNTDTLVNDNNYQKIKK